MGALHQLLLGPNSTDRRSGKPKPIVPMEEKGEWTHLSGDVGGGESHDHTGLDDTSLDTSLTMVKKKGEEEGGRGRGKRRFNLLCQ